MTESTFKTKRKTALLLLAAILLPLPALLIGIREADVTRHMEALTLETSQETWLRQHSGEKDAWLTPSRNGVPRIRKPPAAVWMNMLAWTGANPENSDPTDLIYRGRLLGIGFALLTLGAIFWIGFQLGGAKLGFGAALVAGSTHALLDQARIDSYDTQLMAWCALAVACGLKAILGKKSQPWFIVAAGIAAALAFLTKGPISLIHTALPLLAMAMVTPGRKADATKSLFGILLTVLLLAAPWYIYLAVSQQEVVSTLFAEYRASRSEFQPPWYYLGLLGMVLPWTFWLVNGLFTPFAKQNREIKTKLLLPWAWFVAVFIAMSIPGAKQQRYIIPILPAVGLLTANAWLRADFRLRGLRILRSIHWGALLTASLLLPLYMFMQPRLLRQGTIKDFDFPGIDPALVIPASLFLTAIALCGYILHRKGRKIAAMVVTAAWMVLSFTLAYHYYVKSYHSVYPQKPDCVRVAQTVGDATLYYLDSPRPPKVSPEEKFMLYTRRIYPPIKAARLPKTKPRFIMTRQTEEQQQLVENLDYRHVFDFHDGRLPRSLYTRPSLTE